MLIIIFCAHIERNKTDQSAKTGFIVCRILWHHKCLITFIKQQSLNVENIDNILACVLPTNNYPVSVHAGQKEVGSTIY